MPQLEFATYSSQIFWLLLTFGLLFIIMNSFIVPHLKNIITSRDTKIDTDLLQAEQLKRNAKNIDDNIEREYQKARQGANKKISAALKEAQIKIADSLIAQEQEIIEKAHFAEHKIETAIKNSQVELQNLSENIVAYVLNHFLADKSKDIDVTAAIKEAKAIYQEDNSKLNIEK